MGDLVDKVGADPTTPEGNGFTVRRICRFATYPYKLNGAVGGTRIPKGY